MDLRAKVWADESDQIAEGIGKLANANPFPDHQWPTIQLCSGLHKSRTRIVKRRNAPVCNLARATRRNLAVGKMKAQLRRANADGCKVLIKEGNRQLQTCCVPFGSSAYGRHEHQDVIEREQHGEAF